MSEKFIPKSKSPHLPRRRPVSGQEETVEKPKEPRAHRPLPAFVARGRQPDNPREPEGVEGQNGGHRWKWFLAVGAWRSPAWTAVAGAVSLSVISAYYFFGAGLREGKRAAEIAVEASLRKSDAGLRPEVSTELDAALEKMQTGDLKAAKELLAKLEKIRPPISSVVYYQALAAVRLGELDEAVRKAEESIERGERVSDSLALQAVIETLKAGDRSQRPLGDPSIRAEKFLREAVVADPANPAPLIGLARLARARGKNEEALRLLRGARSRLHPVDNSTTVDVTVELTRLQGLTDDQLPQDNTADRGVVETFGGAYTAMRRGDYARAVQLLEDSRRNLSPDIFIYLLHDPAIRRYAEEPALARYFKGS